MSNIQQFKMREGAFAEMRKKLLVKMTPVFIGFLVFIVLFDKYNPQNKDGNIDPFMIVIMCVVFVVGIYIGLKKLQKIIESYTLTFTGTSIIREQHNTPSIEISYAEITAIVKGQDGSLSVIGNSKLNAIGIFAQIEQRERVEELLAALKPITEATTGQTFLVKYGTILALPMIGAMAGVYLSNNKIIVALCGFSIVCVFVYSFYVRRKSKNIDNQTKKSEWVSILVLLSIVAIVYYKLTTLS